LVVNFCAYDQVWPLLTSAYTLPQGGFPVPNGDPAKLFSQSSASEKRGARVGNLEEILAFSVQLTLCIVPNSPENSVIQRLPINFPRWSLGVGSRGPQPTWTGNAANEMLSTAGGFTEALSLKSHELTGAPLRHSLDVMFPDQW